MYISYGILGKFYIELNLLKVMHELEQFEKSRRKILKQVFITIAVVNILFAVLSYFYGVWFLEDSTLEAKDYAFFEKAVKVLRIVTFVLGNLFLYMILNIAFLGSTKVRKVRRKFVNEVVAKWFEKDFDSVKGKAEYGISEKKFRELFKIPSAFTIYTAKNMIDAKYRGYQIRYSDVQAFKLTTAGKVAPRSAYSGPFVIIESKKAFPGILLYIQESYQSLGETLRGIVKKALNSIPQVELEGNLVANHGKICCTSSEMATLFFNDDFSAKYNDFIKKMQKTTYLAIDGKTLGVGFMNYGDMFEVSIKRKVNEKNIQPIRDNYENIAQFVKMIIDNLEDNRQLSI